MATRTDAPVSLEAGDNLTRDALHRRHLAPEAEPATVAELRRRAGFAS